MVSVVLCAVNNFGEQFFVMYYSVSSPRRVQLGGGRGHILSSWARAASCCRCLLSVIFLSLSLFYLHSQFYTHFICTHGTQINYKCELSSKLFKDHFLLLIMKPFIISYIKSHCLCNILFCILSSILCK